MKPETELKRNLTQALLVAGDAERLLIGSLMIAQDCLRLDETRRYLHPEQFAGDIWRASYEAILDLSAAGKTYSGEYVAPLVAEACSMDVGDVVRIFMDAMDSVGRLDNATEYAQSVVRQWQHCQLRQLSITLVHQLGQPGAAIDDVISATSRDLDRIRNGYIELDNDEFNLKSNVEEFLNQPDAEVIPTGIGSFDSGVRDGLRRGQFVVVGARPGVGKSAFCGQIALNMTQSGYPVMFLSCEMSKNEMTARWVNQASLILSDELDRELFESQPLKSIASSGWTIDRVESETKVAVARHGLAVLVIDYLGLIRPSDTTVNRAEQISDMTRRMKILAMQQNIVILAAHQFNRAKEGRETSRPKMSDFRDSGSIEQDADILIGLHRDLTPEKATEAWVYIMKQRSGETSDLEMSFDGSRTRFTDKIPALPDYI